MIRLPVLLLPLALLPLQLLLLRTVLLTLLLPQNSIPIVRRSTLLIHRSLAQDE